MPNFPKVKLITVGKVKKAWIRQGIETYLKRVPELTLTVIKDAGLEKEATKGLELKKGSDRLIVLAEEGQTQTSVQLAQWLSQADSGTLLFFLGGAEGVSDRLKQNADHLLSLSPMTFPHELAQLMFVEQLYRAKTILQGQEYHK
ncbi:MAG: 23S rRNA (pseudouridine(1915)-N(3))-methyltransferase RlmH [Cyanothece sp. SIO2G6]|nr:23S rRNA (pseudouridine(1915)-N(3))-methyltransferase RlmH [Cyanothece sp. SIO2G6]